MLERELVWERIADANDIQNLASLVADKVAERPADSPFCLWLIGGLGAGKTTLTGALLRVLGLPKEMPVTSPTYTYMNEYRCGSEGMYRWYAHLDLYRAKADCDLADLGIFDTRPFSGYIIEWPERLVRNADLLPTHILSIEVVEGGAKRAYRLEKVL